MDQRRAATDVGGSNETSNMSSKEKQYRIEYGVVLDDQGSTDTYDSVAEAWAAATNETPLVRIVTTPLDAPAVESPSRKQIAEALWESARQEGDDPVWTWQYLTERADRDEGDYAEIRAEYYRSADAVLALFPQPAPSAEPSVQVPVSLVQRARDVVGACEFDDDVFDELNALVSRSPAPAEPVSIADMAPGTSFGCTVDSHNTKVLRFMRTSEGAVDEDGTYWPVADIDPSTIRDVTPPAATPEDKR